MFSHLRAHTEYSIKDGTLKLSEYVKKAKKEDINSVAITDLDNMFGVVRFYKQARENGVKPIIGADITVEGFGDQDFSRVVVICKNNDGYKKLMSVISKSYTQNQINGQPIVKREWLKELTPDVFCLSGEEISSNIIKNIMLDNLELAKGELDDLKSIFGDSLFIELQRSGSDNEDKILKGMLSLSEMSDLAVCATHPIQFLEKDDFLAHEVKVCVGSQEILQDKNRSRKYNPYQYMLGQDEMVELFKDIPEAIINTNAIAAQCNVKIELGKNYLPDFKTDDGSPLNDFFAKTSREGLVLRMEKLFPDASERASKFEEYNARLETEIKTIVGMGFPGYFMIVSDFIKWAKNNDIPVGPGRGSGAGSIVAFALNITELDPIKYDLLFERFLNPERVSMPDFDVDFCSVNRGRVIEYVKNKYGSEAVCQIATIGTMSAKSALRDVGRVLDYNYNLVDQVAKMIPNEIDITLDDALEKEPRLKERVENDPAVAKMYALAQRLEGVPRGVGMHAGGVLIAPNKITDFSPVYLSEDSTSVVSQYDKDDVEKAGLVKFDFLGVNILTLIDKTVKLIKEKVPSAKKIDINDLGFTDPEVFKLINAGNVTGIFQIEGKGIRETAVRMGIDNFEDLIAILALYRPGPLNSGMVDDYIKRKHGEKEFEYMHPMLEEVLKPTYGVIVYQEQVMQIAQVLAGYTLGGADLLRRAMGKKKPEEMEKQSSIFIEGAKKNGVTAENAKEIFNLIEYFAEYGFNKSHSAVYAYISYQTAYLKSHYPAYFLAATMSSDMQDTDQLKILVADSKVNNIQILPPDVNSSSFEFDPTDGSAIRYGLGGLKGVGEPVAIAIQQIREESGNFTSLMDFIERVGRKHANKRTCESLIKSGAFDSIDPNRAKLFENLPKYLEYVDKLTKRVKEQESTLSEILGPDPQEKVRKKKVKDALVPPIEFEVEEWKLIDKLTHEKNAIGFYMTGNPLDYYKKEIPQLVDYPKLNELADYKSDYNDTYICGLINEVKVITSKNGKMAFINIGDGEHSTDVTVFSRVFEEAKDLFVAGEFIMFAARIGNDKRREGAISVIGNDAYSFSDMQEKLVDNITIKIDETEVKEFFDAFRPDFKRGGNCKCLLSINTPNSTVELPFKSDILINYDQDLTERIKSVFGEDSIVMGYKKTPPQQPKNDRKGTNKQKY